MLRNASVVKPDDGQLLGAEEASMYRQWLVVHSAWSYMLGGPRDKSQHNFMVEYLASAKEHGWKLELNKHEGSFLFSRGEEQEGAERCVRVCGCVCVCACVRVWA